MRMRPEESVIKGAPELIAALKRAYQATESKLSETTTPESYEAVNDRMMSRTDPDAADGAAAAGDSSRPRYHHHRAIDDQEGVVTAVETTPGVSSENRKLLGLIEQHEANTGKQASTVAVARSQVWDARELCGLRRARPYQSHGR